MTCPTTVHSGVYALGAAEAEERMLVESRLSTCPGCPAELARLEPLPGLLARLRVSLRAGDPPCPDMQRRPGTPPQRAARRCFEAADRRRARPALRPPFARWLTGLPSSPSR
jgi:anti-sigma factor RsiW